MYVIFNQDGSIKEQVISEFIQQDNNGANTIKIAIDGRNTLTYSLGISCKLPNDEVVSFSSFTTTTITDRKEVSYPAYAFSIPSTITKLPGIVRINLVCSNTSNGQVLVTYSLYLSVNEGVDDSIAAIISTQEYQNLVQIIGFNVLKDQTILTLDSLPSPTGFEEGQVIVVLNDNIRLFYQLKSGSWTTVFNMRNYYTKSETDNAFAKLGRASNVFAYSPQTSETIDDASSGTKFTTKDYVVGKVNNLQGQITTNANDIDTIESKIPSQASSENKLADTNFVNSTVNSLAAFYITKNAAGDPFDSVAQLMSATVFYSGGQLRNPTRNDYCMVNNDENHDGAACRYIYQGGIYPEGQWEFQFVVNETPYTAEQIAAINSGITAALVAQITTNQSAISGIDSKLPIIKDFTIPTTAWQLDGTTGRYYAELNAGSDFVIDDNKMKLYTGTSADDNDLIGTYGIMASSSATTQKIRFECYKDNSVAPLRVVNFTVAQFGGNQ